MIRALALFAVALSATAQSQSVQAPRTRDSAGVHIVDNGSTKGTPVALRIADKPTLDLGGLKDDPREEFNSKSPFLTARRLSDGRIVTTDYDSFKLFDPRGKIVRIIGRAGDGPGEFRQVRDVCVGPGDTIVAIGYGSPRISLFDTTGRHVRSFVVDGYFGPGACFSDGSLLAQTHYATNPSTKMSPEAASRLDRVTTAQHVRTDGSLIRSMGMFPAEIMSPQTVSTAFVYGDAIYAGDGRSTEYRVYSASGTLLRIVRWGDPPQPITDDMLLSSSPMPMGAGAPSRSEQLAQLRARPHLETVPAYAKLQVDGAGRVWIEDYFTAPAPRGWTVFDASGALLGRVALPKLGKRPPEIATIGKSEIVLNWRDDADGAAHLSFHPLLTGK